MPPKKTPKLLAEGALTRPNFESDKYKTDKKNDKNIESVLVAGFFGPAERPAGDKGLFQGPHHCRRAKFWPATPLVKRALPTNSLLAFSPKKAESHGPKEAGLAVEILDEKKIASLQDGRAPPQRRAGWPRGRLALWSSPTRLRVQKPGATRPLVSSAKAVTFDNWRHLHQNLPTAWKK